MQADEKCNASIGAMQGVLPSYTPLGMASLLPHKTIEYSPFYDVLVDGKACSSTEQREAILKEYKISSKCVQFDSMKTMKQADLTLDDLYELWKDLKRGLKNNTFENYKYIYETFVRRQIGSKRVSTFLKSDIKRFYNYLVDERGLKPATVDGVHNILHQIFDMAVDDNYIGNNPTNNVLNRSRKI